MTPLRQLISEIHRRSLWQVLAIYGVASWIIYQVVIALWEGLGLPEWVPGTALVLLLVGLPIVLATAFVQEAPPGRTPPASEPERVVHRSLTWRNAILGGVLAFTLLAIGAVASSLLMPQPGAPADDGSRVIAVLPFENMSADPEDAYFTDGVHEEILAQLAGIGDLRVISRTSVMEYRDRSTNLRQIAAELGARYILEGSVRRFGDRVRITAQLIEAISDQHLWADTYDRERTDLFAIQAQVAERIVRTLAAELSPTERARIEVAPTTDIEAHDRYLQANQYVRSGYSTSRANQAIEWRAALDLYGEAVRRDSTFVLAMGAMAVHRCRMSWYGHDLGSDNVASARALLDRATRGSDAPEIHVAEGIYWYWCQRAYDRALASLERAGPIAAAFESTSVPGFQGFILRRQGRFEEALERLGRAVDLDPRNASLIQNVGWLAAWTDELVRARRYLERAAALAPTDPATFRYLAHVALLETGDPGRARDELGRYRGPAGDLVADHVLNRLEAGDPDGALAALSAAPEGAVLDGQEEVWPVDLLAAIVHHDRGDTERARASFAESRRILAAEHAGSSGRHERHLTTLALAEAGLGMRSEALAHARQAAARIPSHLDAWAAYHYQDNLVWTYVLLGDYPAALTELEILMASPRHPPPKLLRLDPRWKPLRDDPRFEALAAS